MEGLNVSIKVRRMLNQYKVLSQQVYRFGSFSIVPIRYEDRFVIMKWRNEQIYHLRQSKTLTAEDQSYYFDHVISSLFDQQQPNQVLFSYLDGENCIGYGGLVHINWVDKNAEISFIMNTSLENQHFDYHWKIYLNLITRLAFDDLNLHKIYTYAFDLRPALYQALEKSGFTREAELKEHCFFGREFIDVVVHSKINNLKLRKANDEDLVKTYEWVNNESVRKYSFSKGEVSFEHHRAWFYAKIKSDVTFYFILENCLNTPLGSVRVDQDDSGNWLISYLIDPQYHGKGLGILILKMLVKKLKEYPERFQGKTLIGKVIGDNVASVKIFRKLKYSEVNLNNTYIFSQDL